MQRILKDNGIKFVQSVWQAGAPQPAKHAVEADEPDAPASVEGATQPRARGLFGILPALRGNADSDDRATEPLRIPDERTVPHRELNAPSERRDAPRMAPPIPPPPEAPISPPQALIPRPIVAEAPPVVPQPSVRGQAAAPVSTASASAGLSRDHVRRLQATLYELGECRRLIDASMGEKS